MHFPKIPSAVFQVLSAIQTLTDSCQETESILCSSEAGWAGEEPFQRKECGGSNSMGFLRMRLKIGMCLAHSLYRETKRKLATGRKPRTQKEAMHRYFRKLSQPRSQVTGLSITSQTHCCCSIPKSSLTLWDPVDCSPSNASVHGISQATILDWMAFSPPRYLPDPGIEPRSPAWQADSLPLSYLRNPTSQTYMSEQIF